MHTTIGVSRAGKLKLVDLGEQNTQHFDSVWRCCSLSLVCVSHVLRLSRGIQCLVFVYALTGQTHNDPLSSTFLRRTRETLEKSCPNGAKLQKESHQKELEPFETFHFVTVLTIKRPESDK
ncbi:hypothetical protein DMENIID0001_096990 [Sergentomyia squamirostris]